MKIFEEEILRYDVKEYNFDYKISKLLNCELNFFHKKYTTHHTNIWMGGKSPKSKEQGIINFVDKVYAYFREDSEFQKMWHTFCQKVIKKNFFDDESIVIQRLPSIKIVPAKSKLYYSEYIIQDGIKINAHTDGGEPWCHPAWDVNFWMPLTNTNDDNTIYVEDTDGNLSPRILEHGQILKFDGNRLKHGSKVYNESEFSRVSFDFRALKLKNYDINLLSEKDITSRGEKMSQRSYYNHENYYMKVL